MATHGGLTFVDNTDGTATLSGTPAAADGFSFTINAANGIDESAGFYCGQVVEEWWLRCW